jgi:5-methylcytosine-specific restriction enzyme subunit McrC
VNGEIPVRNAWHMLLYAWDMLTWRGQWDAAAEESPGLLGLLARVLVDTTRPLLRRALARSFVEQHETLAGVRGKIDFSGSLKRLAFEAGRARCSFAALDIDTPRNRILRATMQRLARDPRVTLPSAQGAQKAERVRHELRELVGAMEGVSTERLTGASFSRLQLGRADRPYALPLAICALVHRLEMPTEAVGDTTLAALQRDERWFHQLFERFVRNFLRHHLADHDIVAEVLQWFDELASPHVPAMKTDMAVTRRSEPQRRLVIDTKYYANTLSESHRGGGAKFHAGHLYQMYAYLRTQEHRGDLYRDADGLLLYPTTNGDLRETMQLQGHRIHVATVDLARPWPEVEARLLALVE